ncbi:hypothetical protein EW093_15665 [Thiospirochaeta perfilievii]|uniref:Lipoprotein n=1 Tax=Thiospirochaeta perfilievii TaxID=252967 RepID=A0A5C1QII8_9SPIO|nr:hypothetical protein [Thiospirochaeta perfilievii]QEN06062.1 hypothetical protein EW093_15665 [Thiospirochaeta perfilievii]
MKNIIILFLTTFLVLSCSSNHIIDINEDNSATVKFNTLNKESLVKTLYEWGAIDSNNNGSIINPKELEKGLERNYSISNVNVESTIKNRYSGSFNVSNINNIFYNPLINIPDNNKIFSITEGNGDKTFKINLSIDNYKYLKEFLPILKLESIDMLGPDANQGISQDEYMEMMSFSLGDDGPNDILGSYINLKININGTITSIVGGKIENNSSAIFNIPLLDVILLKKTLIYSFTYN